MACTSISVDFHLDSFGLRYKKNRMVTAIYGAWFRDTNGATVFNTHFYSGYVASSVVVSNFFSNPQNGRIFYSHLQCTSSGTAAEWQHRGQECRGGGVGRCRGHNCVLPCENGSQSYSPGPPIRSSDENKLCECWDDLSKPDWEYGDSRLCQRSATGDRFCC